jgi:hypothetical protein
MINNYTINQATINKNFKKRVIVIDDFYENPDYVREFALKQNLELHPDNHKGYRTDDRFFAPHMKEAFERIMGVSIVNWYDGEYCNGVFQYCTSEEQLVYHCDGQDWAGAVYLTPNAPYDCGTSLFASKLTGARDAKAPDFNYDKVFPCSRRRTPKADHLATRSANDGTPFEDYVPFLDSTIFEKVDDIGNVYNRLVLWDAQLIHSASKYFGNDRYDSRLFHLFFFNIEK